MQPITIQPGRTHEARFRQRLPSLFERPEPVPFARGRLLGELPDRDLATQQSCSERLMAFFGCEDATTKELRSRYAELLHLCESLPASVSGVPVLQRRLNYLRGEVAGLKARTVSPGARFNEIDLIKDLCREAARLEGEIHAHEQDQAEGPAAMLPDRHREGSADGGVGPLPATDRHSPTLRQRVRLMSAARLERLAGGVDVVPTGNTVARLHAALGAARGQGAAGLPLTSQAMAELSHRVALLGGVPLPDPQVRQALGRTVRQVVHDATDHLQEPMRNALRHAADRYLRNPVPVP